MLRYDTRTKKRYEKQRHLYIGGHPLFYAQQMKKEKYHKDQREQKNGLICLATLLCVEIELPKDTGQDKRYEKQRPSSVLAFIL